MKEIIIKKIFQNEEFVRYLFKKGLFIDNSDEIIEVYIDWSMNTNKKAAK